MSPSIVLVHGGFVDGAGWRGVYDALRGDGYAVRIVLGAGPFSAGRGRG